MNLSKLKAKTAARSVSDRTPGLQTKRHWDDTGPAACNGHRAIDLPAPDKSAMAIKTQRLAAMAPEPKAPETGDPLGGRRTKQSTTPPAKIPGNFKPGRLRSGHPTTVDPERIGITHPWWDEPQ